MRCMHQKINDLLGILVGTIFYQLATLPKACLTLNDNQGGRLGQGFISSGLAVSGLRLAICLAGA